MKKVFKAWVTQDGINNPTVDLHKNTIGAVSLLYNDIGGVTVSSAGLFTGRVAAKLTLQSGSPTDTYCVDALDGTPNSIYINLFRDGAPSNVVMQKAYLEITCGL